MTNDDDQSRGGGETIAGGSKRRDTGSQSLSDEATFAGGMGRSGPQSFGDEVTFGGGAGGDDGLHDDGMEVIDLSARYTVEGVLGKGGMGEVLLATDTRLNRKVAIKRMLGEVVKSRTAVSRFLTEAQSIAALNHPNIVQIYDYGRAADGPFLIMEYVEGNSLLDKCRKGAIPLEEAIELTCQVCDGLGTAHEANIIHRDIKPANVLLTKTGSPKLTDFGLAKDETADAGLSVAGAVLGTLDFMPPEQRKDVALTDSRSDLWSLAATLYQMVTGQSPKIIRFNNVPQSLHDVLGKALEDQKDDRYQTAKEFRDALKAALHEANKKDLGEGECPSCGTKNESKRKFCRSCATSLEAPCMSCQSGIPVWENVCGSCGTKQDELLQQRRDEQQDIRNEAESRLDSGNFALAAQLAKKLAEETDSRLQDQKAWAEKFLEDLDERKKQLQEEARCQLEEAQKHFKAHDYEAALQSVRKIPESIAGIDVADIKQRAQESLDEVNDLSDQIRKRIAIRELDGVRELVERYLELKPEADNFRELKADLENRAKRLQGVQEAALSQATSLYDAGDDEKCLAYIAGLSSEQKHSAIIQLEEHASQRAKLRQHLRKKIVLQYKKKDYSGLLNLCDEYLELASADPEITKIHDRLKERDSKLDEQIAQLRNKIDKLQTAGDVTKAIAILEKVPNDKWNQELSDLQNALTILAESRSDVLQKLNESSSRKDIQKALRSAKNYQADLVEKTSGDEQLMDSIRKAQERVEVLLAEEESAARRSRFMRRLYVTMACVVLITAGAAFVLNRQQRQLAAAIADARSRGEQSIAQSDFPAAVAAFDELLELQPLDAQGLIARATAKLQLDGPDINSASTDISAAETAGASASILKQAKGLLACCETESLAASGNLTEAESKLQLVRDLQPANDLTTRAERAVGEALPKEAADLAASFKPEDAIVSLKRAGGFPVDPGELIATGAKVAAGFVEKARSRINIEAFDEAMTYLDQARSLDASNVDLDPVNADLYVRRAQTALKTNDRETAIADFFQARKLNSQAPELGDLAAGLAAGMVERCETDFSEEAYQEATAALVTVAEVDPATSSLKSLKDRLGKVLVMQGETALVDGRLLWFGEIIQSLNTLDVLPDDRALLSGKLLTAASDALKTALDTKNLAAVAEAVNLFSSLDVVDQVKRDQVITDATVPISELLLEELEGDQPKDAAAAVMLLVGPIPGLVSAMRDGVSKLPTSVKEILPENFVAATHGAYQLVATIKHSAPIGIGRAVAIQGDLLALQQPTGRDGEVVLYKISQPNKSIGTILAPDRLHDKPGFGSSLCFTDSCCLFIGVLSADVPEGIFRRRNSSIRQRRRRL